MEELWDVRGDVDELSVVALEGGMSKNKINLGPKSAKLHQIGPNKTKSGKPRERDEWDRCDE